MAAELTLHNSALSVVVSRYGAALVGVHLDGSANLVVGPQAWPSESSQHYLGSVIGRYSRLVRRGELRIDGRVYTLSRNADGHHLHGGHIGFAGRQWSVRSHTSRRVTLSHRDVAGTEGYPGTVEIDVTYEIQGTNLRMTSDAVTDSPTLFGISPHVFWNLAGSRTIDDHHIHADVNRRVEQDADFVPTGRLLSVDPLSGTLAGVEIDAFYTPRRTPWRVELACSGTTTDIIADSPGLAIYTGDHLPEPRKGICIQPSPWPDCPHFSHFPSAILRPGQRARNVVTYRLAHRKTTPNLVRDTKHGDYAS